MRMPTLVVTRSVIDPDHIHTRKLIDWNNKSDRIWFGNHQQWALTHSWEITTTPQPIHIPVISDQQHRMDIENAGYSE